MMDARILISSVAAFGMTVAMPFGQHKVNLSTKAIVAAATQYVADYQTKFKFLIADESSRQMRYDRNRLLIASRAMKGELFLTFIPADAVWVAVHDFAEVDGIPLVDREDLRTLLQKGETASVARHVMERNARFNLGGVVRNFNEPTLALLVFEAKRVKGISFDREEVKRDGTRTTVRLSFKERERPTLVRGARGTPVYAKGELTIDAGTGRVEQTVIELKDGPVQARLVTTYALDDKVQMWVPISFGERYERSADDGELILCQSDYTNYRKFDVTARIK
jgi:hypothetical protein